MCEAGRLCLHMRVSALCAAHGGLLERFLEIRPPISQTLAAAGLGIPLLPASCGQPLRRPEALQNGLDPCETIFPCMPSARLVTLAAEPGLEPGTFLWWLL